MPYIGTGVPNRALTSADIAQGAVTLDDISFTDQPTNLNILGTIDKHTMRLADGVTVTGDVTLSDNLIFAKLSDDGNAITLTDDGSTRTITGTGSIEASTLAQTPNSSLTGMTGELGSAVTGTLGSGIIFPAGHVLQMKGDSYTRTSALAITASSGLTIGSDLEVAITCASTSNFLHISTFIPDVAVLDSNCALHVGFKYSTASPFGSGTSLGKTYVNSHDGYITNNDDILFGSSTELWVQVPTTTAMKIQVFTTAIISGGGVVKIMNNSPTATFNEASLIVTEVQG